MMSVFNINLETEQIVFYYGLYNLPKLSHILMESLKNWTNGGINRNC